MKDKNTMSKHNSSLMFPLLCNAYIEKSITNTMVDQYINYLQQTNIERKHYKVYKHIFKSGFKLFKMSPPFGRNYPKKELVGDAPFENIFFDWEYAKKAFHHKTIPISVIAASMIFPYTFDKTYKPCIVTSSSYLVTSPIDCIPTYALKKHSLVDSVNNNYGMCLFEKGNHMYNWYDLEEFIQLYDDIKLIQKIFLNIVQLLRQKNKKDGYFHGNLHCKNVLVHPLTHEIKLIHLEYSGRIYDKDDNYKLKQKYTFEFYKLKLFKNNLTSSWVFKDKSFIHEKALFLYAFDVYRLYMSILLVHEYGFWSFDEIPLCFEIRKHIDLMKKKKKQNELSVQWHELMDYRYFNQDLVFTKNTKQIHEWWIT